MYGLTTDFLDRNVAIYARVSTEHEAQLSALENQIDWYKPILDARPGWKLTDRYIDEGITGTSAEKRPQFLQMIADAKTKKFDMIITREVSRFARNTVDTLQYTRLLKEYGVEVFFINDNIKTFDGDGELRLTIMATLAQDESRKTSIRVKAGQQTSMKNGVFYGTGNILGYDRVGREMQINPEQAKTVRMIYDMYLSGMGVAAIGYELEKACRLTSMGNEKWFPSYISRILKNTFYAGIITYRKEFVPDYLKQKRKRNRGELEHIQVHGTHVPIVSEEEFQEVQRIMAGRRQRLANDKKANVEIGYKPPKTIWGDLLICQCGKHFNLHTDRRNNRTESYSFMCYTTVNTGSRSKREKTGLSLEGTCDSPYLPLWKLELMAFHIFKEHIRDTERITDIAMGMLEKHISDEAVEPDNETAIARKHAEIEALTKKKDILVEMRMEGEIDKACFQHKKQEIDAQIEKLNGDIMRLKPQCVKPVQCNAETRLAHLKQKLETYTDFGEGKVPECTIQAFVEKIWVSREEFRWYLRSGDGGTADGRDNERVKIADFTLTLEDAKKYQYSFSTKKRIYRWTDLHVTLWV